MRLIIPIKNKNNNLHESADKNHLTLTIYRNSPIDNLINKLLNMPPKIDIEFDEFKTTIWKSIDGKKSVYEICKSVNTLFAKKNQTVYKQIIEFLHQLADCRLIKFKARKTPIKAKIKAKLMKLIRRATT